MKNIRRITRFTLTLLFFSLIFGLDTRVSLASVFTVNSTNDANDGTCNAAHCSLREAINAANANADQDTIAFNIPGPGPHNIQPDSALPAIINPVIIDGYTQPGASPNTLPPGSGINAMLQIELDGSQAGQANVDGLLVTAGNSTIRGLVINQFSGDGIALFGDAASGNVIEGNFIGTDVTGTVALGNGGEPTLEDLGVRVGTSASGNTVRDNVISGNVDGGLSLDNGAFDNSVYNNLIGTDPSGTLAVGNDGKGLTIQSDAHGNMVQDNLISGNNGLGVIIGGTASTTGNQISGNFIGTDVTGTMGLGNSSTGVLIYAGGSSNTIGGTAPGAGNVISANGGQGVLISGNGVTENLVQSNLIGADASGTQELGNGAGGVTISAGATNNLIGGTDVGAGNVISGNGSGGFGSGVNIQSPGAEGNLVQGNYIGTDVTGGAALGDQAFGVELLDEAANNTIGGTAAGAGNVIAFHGSIGILMADDAANNLIAGNSIFANGDLGIDLDIDGVTPNDMGDTDTGANTLQNFPVLTSIIDSDTVEGTLNSTPNTDFTLEFFSNAACDPSGFGEGQTFLGSVVVTTDSSGNASYTHTLATPIVLGEFITATATDPSNNTSEFSECKLFTTDIYLPLILRNRPG